ncbi:MAG: ribonuclease [Clostridia bacterium]|nr:ribonuclease [Clostridia bacterium]
MKTNKKQLLVTLLTVLAILAVLVLLPRLGGSADAPAEETLALLTGARETAAPETEKSLDEAGSYTSKEDVALYLHLYGRLPANFITKSAAQKLGWDSSEGNLDKVAPGKSIGGDVFGNREGLLPAKSGRTYYECDVGYAGGYRGGERIVYSNDGLIYYSGDHYANFTLLYGEP